MRHSLRLDDTAESFAAITPAEWPDKMTRPYDSPISDHSLPVEAAQKLIKYKVTRIVSSPFRRCIQTSALVARTLGVSRVEVDSRLGEHVDAVMRCFVKAGIPDRKAPVRLLSVDAAPNNVEGNWRSGSDLGMGWQWQRVPD